MSGPVTSSLWTPLARIFTPPPGEGFSPPVVAAASADPDSPGLSDRAAADDVLHYPPEVRDGNLTFRLEAAAGNRQVAGISYLAARSALDQLAGPADRGERELRGLLAAALEPLARSGAAGQRVTELAAAVVRLLGGLVRDSDVVVQPAGDGLRVIVTDRRRPAADEDLRQVLTPAREPVTLAAHQQAVAERARLLATHAGLAVSWLARWARRGHIMTTARPIPGSSRSGSACRPAARSWPRACPV